METDQAWLDVWSRHGTVSGRTYAHWLPLDAQLVVLALHARHTVSTFRNFWHWHWLLVVIISPTVHLVRQHPRERTHNRTVSYIPAAAGLQVAAARERWWAEYRYELVTRGWVVVQLAGGLSWHVHDVDDDDIDLTTGTAIPPPPPPLPPLTPTTGSLPSYAVEDLL